MSVTGSTSEAAQKSRQGRGCLGAFFVVFLVIGLIAFYFVFVQPLTRILGARNWRPTPCTILKSEVVRHSGSKGSTYSIGVSFEYFVEDQRYTASRYSFTTGSSSGYEGKKAVVDRLAPGTAATCYVNRRDPTDAVLERGVTAELFFGLLSLIFVIVGGGGLYAVFIYKKKPPQPGELPGLPASAVPTKARGAATLKSSQSPGGRLGCSIAIALFWNGIVSIFLVQVISGWANGNPDGCATAFFVPFGLVGVGLIVLVVYYILALFNPRPVLRVSAASAALGDTVEVEWETQGNVDRVRRFTITLEGREEATYRRGTRTTTDKSTFRTLEIVASSRGKEMRRGKAKVAIPADTMHTFKSSNNKILWSFHLKGEIPRWPDVGEEFAFEVLPQRLPPGGAA